MVMNITYKASNIINAKDRVGGRKGVQIGDEWAPPAKLDNL